MFIKKNQNWSIFTNGTSIDFIMFWRQQILHSTMTDCLLCAKGHYPVSSIHLLDISGTESRIPSSNHSSCHSGSEEMYNKSLLDVLMKSLWDVLMKSKHTCSQCACLFSSRPLKAPSHVLRIQFTFSENN